MSDKIEKDITPLEKKLLSCAKIIFKEGVDMSAYWIESLTNLVWGLEAQKNILPNALEVYAELVKQNIDETKSLDFNDLDDHIFYVKTDNGTMVFVHTTQNRDYLYIISDECRRLDIRRIWRVFKNDSDLIPKVKSAQNMLNNADVYSEYSDQDRKDQAYMISRPGLEFYRKAKFEIPSYRDKNSIGVNLYGDCRDHGYILSYKEPWVYRSKEYKEPKEFKYISQPVVEYANTHELKYIVMYLDSIMQAMKENNE